MSIINSFKKKVLTDEKNSLKKKIEKRLKTKKTQEAKLKALKKDLKKSARGSKALIEREISKLKFKMAWNSDMLKVERNILSETIFKIKKLK